MEGALIIGEMEMIFQKFSPVNYCENYVNSCGTPQFLIQVL